MNIEDEKKKIIMQELGKKEEDILQQFESMVKKSKHFISIDLESNRLIFERTDFSNYNKVGLLLIGAYFKKHLSSNESKVLSLQEISKILEVPLTTLSAPINSLIQEGFVLRLERGNYEIAYYKIESFLEKLMSKYGEKNGTR
jgi:DNA-binding transcriptional ArsR family regulator